MLVASGAEAVGTMGHASQRVVAGAAGLLGGRQGRLERDAHGRLQGRVTGGWLIRGRERERGVRWRCASLWRPEAAAYQASWGCHALSSQTAHALKLNTQSRQHLHPAPTPANP